MSSMRDSRETHDPEAEPRTVVPTTRARQGVTGHHVRLVLGVGLVAIVVAFVVIYVFYFG